MPLVSIIIPTYNSEALLAKTLESIAKQGFTDYEVILQDGLSNDKTLDVARAYEDKLTALDVLSEKDGGVYEAMNKAMRRAHGDWIIFMGSDDVFHNSQILQSVSKVLKTTSADVVYGSVKVIGDTFWAKDGSIFDGPFTLQKLLNQNICHQAMFYRRSFIQETIGDFNPKYSISADWDYNLRCWAVKPFEYIDLVVSDFSAGGVSTPSGDDKLAADFVSNLMEYFKIGPFNKLINRRGFIYYQQVVELQKKRSPLIYLFRKIRTRIKKMIKT